MAENESKKQELNEDWIDRILDKCEEAEVSKGVIKRFFHYYVSQGEMTVENLIQLLKDLKIPAIVQTIVITKEL